MNKIWTALRDIGNSVMHAPQIMATLMPLFISIFHSLSIFHEKKDVQSGVELTATVAEATDQMLGWGIPPAHIETLKTAVEEIIADVANKATT